MLAHLADRQLLLILDTCEHLIDACAMFAEAVIARAPRVTMLATSREPLDVSGENACPVAPLPVPGDASDAGTPAGTAVELFIQRAAAAVPGYAFTPDDLPQVIRLCRRLDGIPLAIELAAVRLRALPLAELASRLDQRLALLASGHGARHRTLRDAIGWSHDLCTPAEQALWARLSVFGGPFTMSAAEEVCAGELGPGQVMPALIRLVDKSILVRAGQRRAPAAPGQARPAHQVPDARHLPRVRRGTARRLGRRGGHQRGRFTGRYLAMAAGLRDHFLDDDQLGRLRELRREHDNIRAALDCALGDADAETAEPARARPPGRPTAARRRTASSSPPRCSTTGAAAASPAKAASGSARPSRGARRLGRPGPRAARARPPARDAGQRRPRARRRVAGHRPGRRARRRRAGGARPPGQDHGADHGGRLTEAAEAGDEARRLLTALGDRPGLIDLDIQLTYLALLSGDSQAAFRLVETCAAAARRLP